MPFLVTITITIITHSPPHRTQHHIAHPTHPLTELEKLYFSLIKPKRVLVYCLLSIVYCLLSRLSIVYCLYSLFSILYSRAGKPKTGEKMKR